MPRYSMDGGTVVDTDNATDHWTEKSSNKMDDLQTLFRSRRGRYYLVHTFTTTDWAEWISRERAAAWLTLHEHKLPQELREAAKRVTE